MKLTTIKQAIQEWKSENDHLSSVLHLISEGELFKIPRNILLSDEVADINPLVTSIHAYPGIIDGSLKMILINNVMDSKAAFDRNQEKITKYIFVEDLHQLDITRLNEFIDADSYSFKQGKDTEQIPHTYSGRDRIIQWLLCKEEWANIQIKNVYGMFESFNIPLVDIKGDYIYAFFALRERENLADDHIKNTHVADLILWDSYAKRLYTSGLNDELEDTVSPVPPYGNSVDDNESAFYLIE